MLEIIDIISVTPSLSNGIIREEMFRSIKSVLFTQ